MKTMHNKPITLIGNEVTKGQRVPDFTVISNTLEETHLSDFKDDYILLNVVPSLDTSVCNLQTRRINQQLSDNKKIKILTISCDLPFAQKRWCGAEGLDITTLSDYKYVDFGTKYGLLIDELRLLARAVIILDKERKVIYKEYVDEMSNHPNYDSLLEFINQNIK